MINDSNWTVRAEIARNGYGLDKLVNDKSKQVREEIERIESQRNRQKRIDEGKDV